MKVLIGTPIHEIKDYCMEKWLANVAELQKVTQADLLLVDNSPGLSYVEKVREYCKKYKIKNYKITHLELPEEQKIFERVARSREIIRQEVLHSDYNAWFSWECDQLIPKDALSRLINVFTSGNFVLVSHNNWTREIPDLQNFDFGVALISRKALQKYSFILEFGTDPEMPNTWEPGEAWFRRRVVRGGDSFLEINGVIKPIYHLDK